MPRRNRSPLAFSVGLAAGVATTLLAIVASQALADRSSDPYAPLDRFAQVYSDIERHYVEEVDPDVLITAAIEGMVSELDPHSRWLDAEAFRAMNQETEGRYEGIGAEVRSVPDGVVVVRVLPGGPAARDGLLRGDVIIAINGHAVVGEALDAVSKHLKGPRGSAVVLSVQREGRAEPVEVRTVRDRIDLVPVQSGIVGGDLAYVRLVSFQEGAAEEVQRAIKAARRDGAQAGVILDLRDNPGGLLSEAVRLVDLFVDDGPIVSTRGRTEGEQVHGATRGGFPPDLPVVVLVNGGSASASEVVVGALQDLGRATIIGTPTYGKGSVQTLFHRGDGGLKLTIARYYTPAGTPIAPHDGRDPDLEVPYPTEHGPRARLETRVRTLDDDALRDELLDLVQALPDDEPLDPVIPWDAPLAERAVEDPQLRAAIDRLQHP